ncbi:MAG: DUF11 domain-containing protein, partial [Holophagales bacterium]|nr:DUF11 domain-containing protein [Holophagales bacterium]
VGVEGALSIEVPPGDPDARVAVGTPRTYFVAVEASAAFDSAPFDAIALRHRTLGSSRARDAAHDTPLRLEGAVPVTTADFTVNPGAVPEADMAVASIAVSPDPVAAEGQVAYTVTVANAGPWPAQAVAVASTLPAGAAFVATAGCENDPSGFPACQLGEVRLGEMPAFTLTATMAAGVSGPVTYGAAVSTTTLDPDPADDSVEEITTVLPPGDLGAGAGATLLPRIDGDLDLEFRVSASNLGGLDEPTATFTAPLPSQLAGASWTCQAFGGASCPASGSGDISETVNLPVGSRIGFRIAGTVSRASGSLSATATVAGDMDDLPANNTASFSIELSSLMIADGFESSDTSAWAQALP